MILNKYLCSDNTLNKYLKICIISAHMKFISEFVVKSDDRYVEILIKYLSDDNSSQSGQF